MSAGRVRIYHNPRCSKSRETLALLGEAGVEAEIVDYLKTPPNLDELRHILELLGGDPQVMLRVKEAAYAESGLDGDSSPAEILEAIASHPVLLERPIVVRGNRAVIGRPPERVQELL